MTRENRFGMGTVGFAAFCLFLAQEAAFSFEQKEQPSLHAASADPAMQISQAQDPVLKGPINSPSPISGPKSSVKKREPYAVEKSI